MNAFIASLLTQDALTVGAIYGLIAVALVIIFSVTRIIFVPQGEIISFAGLTLGFVQMAQTPPTIWLLLFGGAGVATIELTAYLLGDRRRSRLFHALGYGVGAIAIFAFVRALAGVQLAPAFSILLTLLIVVPLAPIVFKLAFEPLGDTSVLVKLMTAVAVHFALQGLSLVAFGAEGVRTIPVFPGQTTFAGFGFSDQSLFVLASTIILMTVTAIFFGRTLVGKALRATAVNRTGARIVGIRPTNSGSLAFVLAGVIGTVSGILISPLVTIYYDTGFLIGLKGFMAAIVGGLVSYPIAVAGAISIGLIETFSSFYASNYKDAIVFALIVPILIWRSFASVHLEEHEE